MEDIKKIPSLRFPEFSGEWEVKRLGTFYPQIRNGFVGTATPYYRKIGVPYLQGKNIKNGQINGNGLIYISEEFHNKNVKSQLKVNDIVMVQSGHVGECALITKENDDNNCHAVLVMTPLKTVYSKFYVYFFYSEIGKKLIHKIKTGNTIEHILSSDAKNLKVSSISDKEQQKIADFLTKIDNKIEQLSKKKQLLESYKKGVMQKIFSQELRFKDDEGNSYSEWEEKKLGDIATFHRGSGLPKSDLIHNGNTKCIHYGELFTIYDEVIKGVKSNTNNTEGVKSVRGDILMPSSDVTPQGLGRASALMKDDVLLGGDINIVRSNKDIDSIFLSYLINYDKNKVIRLVTGTTVKHIYTKDLKTISINLPSLIEEQTKIANFLTEIDNKINLVEKQLTDSKQYKKSLLQQMFI